VVRQSRDALCRKPPSHEKVPALRSRTMKQNNGRMSPRPWRPQFGRKDQRARKRVLPAHKAHRFFAATLFGWRPVARRWATLRTRDHWKHYQKNAARQPPPEPHRKAARTFLIL